MKLRMSGDFTYQVAALLIAIIVVHTVYATAIRPQARMIQLERQEKLAENPDFTPERSPIIMVKDYEQEFCFILMAWAMALLALKAQQVGAQRRLLGTDLLHLAPGESILPEDSRTYARTIEALSPYERDALYPRVLLTVLHRFRSTGNIQDAAEAAEQVCDAEFERLESELSMVRYIAWAIPSIGFIGTVRGIGDALGLAHQAVEGDISGVTESLGVAFNSTLIALLLSIVVMFLLYQLQLAQERLVLDTRAACDRVLIQNLQGR